jgi:hypothetical protein
MAARDLLNARLRERDAAVEASGSRRRLGRLTAKRFRPEMAPQRLEKIESALGNGMGSDASNLQHLVHGRVADRAAWVTTVSPNQKESRLPLRLSPEIDGPADCGGEIFLFANP